MKVVKIIGKKTSYRAVLIAIIGSFILLLVMYTGVIQGINELFYMGLGLLIIVWFIVLFTYFLANRTQRILGVVEELIYGVYDDIILLKKPLLVEYGVVKIVSRRVTRTSIGIPKGKGISIGLTETFDLNSDFERIRGPMLVSRIDLGFFRERGYLMVVDRDINGCIILPVVRILDRRYRGVCITYIDSSMNKVGAGKHIIHSESLYGDKVSIVVHVDKRSISGEITFKKVRARSVHLFILVKPRNASLPYVVEHIVSTSGGYTMFNYSLYPEDRVLMLFVYDRYFPVPPMFAEDIGIKPLIAGFENAEIKLRIIMDLPLRKDIYTDYIIQ